MFINSKESFVFQRPRDLRTEQSGKGLGLNTRRIDEEFVSLFGRDNIGGYG